MHWLSADARSACDASFLPLVRHVAWRDRLRNVCFQWPPDVAYRAGREPTRGGGRRVFMAVFRRNGESRTYFCRARPCLSLTWVAHPRAHGSTETGPGCARLWSYLELRVLTEMRDQTLRGEGLPSTTRLASEFGFAEPRGTGPWRATTSSSHRGSTEGSRHGSSPQLPGCQRP